MFSRNRDDTTRAEQPGGISPAVHSVLAVFSSKEPRPLSDERDGVSTYLALTFGTLLSSQGTDASFVLTRETLSGFPPGASLRSCVSDSIRSFSRSDSLSAGCFPAFRLSGDVDFIRSFRRPTPSQPGLSSAAVGPFRRLTL